MNLRRAMAGDERLLTAECTCVGSLGKTGKVIHTSTEGD